MMPVQLMVIPVWVERLGWTLVHSLWLLTVIAILSAIVLRFMRNRSACGRYAAAVAMLALMVSGPVVTWLLVSVEPVRSMSSLLAAEQFGVGQDVPSSVALEESRLVAVVAIPLAADAEKMNALIPTSEVDVESASETSASATQPGSKPVALASVFRESIEKCARAIKPRLPILVGVWFLGVVICSIRPVWGLWIQWRLRHAGLQPVSDSIQSTLNVLIQKLGLRRVVRVAESALVKVPLVVGYLHPMILLPASVITGLTSSQLEAVLAHELAHVRRHDWLVNTLQVIVETLLFYHPAVWWLSSRIRQERELCCDDIALSLDVDKAVFARTLLTLEELRQQVMTPALAATGGDLAARVRRLLPRPGSIDTSNHRASLTGLLSMATALILLTILVSQSQTATSASVYNGTIQVADQKAQDQESSEPEITGSSVAPSTAQNIVQGHETDSAATNEVRERTVKVVDENEQPIAGAEVRLQYENRSESRAQMAEPLSTDANGEVTVDAPLNFDEVHLSVKAEGFGEFSERQQATGASIIRLKRGRVIHVRAVDETGNILRKAVPLLAMHRVWGREFVPQDDGTFKSPAVEMTRQMMRVAAAQENGPMLFSDLIDVATAEPGEDGILNIVLKPGVRFLGRLDDSVPRPISEGYVSLMIVDGPNHGLGTGAWTWEDSTPVAPDGTFVFESLPGGGHVQFHVTVDGYMSSRLSDEAITKYVTDHQLVSDDPPDQLKKGLEYSSNARPQLAWLNQPEVKVDVPCEKTASCDFRILDPAGKPISNATVSFNPNGHFLFGRHFIPGSPNFPPASLVDQLMRENAALFPGTDKSPRGIAQQKEQDWAMRSFVAAKSDANGRVRIRNLFGGTRESFSVQADGFVMPQSPIYGSENESDFGGRRYGVVDLIAGETIERTVYLDREQVIINREVLVVDEKAKPLEGITVALAEMRVGKNDWQLWSVHRFGTLPQEKTDENGRVLLRIPESIDDAQVQRIRLAVNHRTNRSGELWLAGGLVEASPTADDGVIMVLRNPDSSRSSRAAYGKLDELLPKQSSAELLKAMIENPSLAMLRQLLAETKSPRPVPVELLDEGRFSGERKPAGFRVHVLPSGEGKVAVVLAKVQPADGSRQQEPDFGRLPDCAFVFDMDGKLIAAVGGRIGTTGAGSAENVDILCLGPAEDWFVRVTRFQENGPFVYQSEYYRMVNPVVPSLRYFHYANSNGWSNGPETVPRYGRLHFGFPDDRGSSQIDRIGTTPDGRTFVDSIFWDGDKNQFVGAAELTVEKRPLFRVDTEWSKDFSPLTTTSSQITLLGGEREYDHWYAWETCVPAGYEAIVRVSVPQKEGKPKVIEQTYTSGRQNIQFHAAPTEDNATIKLQLGYGEKATIQTSEVPFTLGDPPTQRPSIVNTLSSGESMTLVQRALMGSEQPLTLSVRLQATKELGLPR